MKLILFDLDGTLIQSTGIIVEVFKMTFNKFFPNVILTDEKVTSFLGQTLWQTFGEYTDDETLIDDMFVYYRVKSEELINESLEAYPNAKQTMKYLKEHGCKIGVVTSKMNVVAKRHLEITELWSYVDTLVGYDDVSNHKPHPDPLLKATKTLNIEPSDAIYIGDHENDIKAAKKAGMSSCAVTYSFRLQQMLSEFPDYVIDDLSNLKGI